jgi:glycosyltransferase involved in cell wall biosynthesis
MKVKLLNNPVVSIIVPVYNAEKYLDKCINSLLNQTYNNVHIILINDGSTDNSGNICNMYSRSDERVFVLHKHNEGVSAARNAGIDTSIGEYLLFVDSDDWLENNTVAELIKIQKKDNFDVIMFGFLREDFNGNNQKPISFQKNQLNSKDEVMKVLPDLIKNESINSPCNKLYKSNIIKDNDIKFDNLISIGEDALFNYKVFLKINCFAIIDNCFYHYIKDNSESLTKKYNPQKYIMLTYVNDFPLQNFNDNILLAAKFIRLKNIYSCLFDIIINDSLSYKDKKNNIYYILIKEDPKNWYDYNNYIYKILRFILNTGNINLIYFSVLLIGKIKRISKLL